MSKENKISILTVWCFCFAGMETSRSTIICDRWGVEMMASADGCKGVCVRGWVSYRNIYTTESRRLWLPLRPEFPVFAPLNFPYEGFHFLHFAFSFPWWNDIQVIHPQQLNVLPLTLRNITPHRRLYATISFLQKKKCQVDWKWVIQLNSLEDAA